MFGLGLATKIYLAVEAVDMRKGFDGLYGLVRDQLGEDPLSGHLFLFTNRQHTRALFLQFPGHGLRFLDKFIVPPPVEEPAELVGAFTVAAHCVRKRRSLPG